MYDPFKPKQWSFLYTGDIAFQQTQDLVQIPKREVTSPITHVNC